LSAASVCSASEIEIGPVYHRLPDRIRAHAAICFMALILYRVMRERLRARSARPVARAGAVPVGPDPAPPCHTQRNPTRFRNLLDQSGANWHSDGLGRQKTDRERAIDPLVVERFYGAPRQINDLRVYLSNSGDRP